MTARAEDREAQWDREPHPVQEVGCLKCGARYMRREPSAMDRKANDLPYCTTPFCWDEAGEPIALEPTDEWEVCALTPGHAGER